MTAHNTQDDLQGSRTLGVPGTSPPTDEKTNTNTHLNTPDNGAGGVSNLSPSAAATRTTIGSTLSDSAPPSIVDEKAAVEASPDGVLSTPYQGDGIHHHRNSLPHDTATNTHDTSSDAAGGADPWADAPPPLPYNLREHKLMISLFWFLILTECTLIPIIFYFAISRLTDLRPGAMFAIITAMFGFISGGEYGLRALRLIQKADTYRPLHGADRWYFDTVHLVLGPPYFVMTAMMIGFSIPDPPYVRGLAITMPVGIAMVTGYMMWTGAAWHLGYRLRWHRISSHLIGDRCPPLTFAIMEDICGCDGGGGKVYREAAMHRFRESPRFQRMLVQMLWAWSVTGFVLGVVLTVLAWTIHAEVGYTLGWGAPAVWGGIGAWLTILWGKRCIRIEHETWVEERRARKAAAA